MSTILPAVLGGLIAATAVASEARAEFTPVPSREYREFVNPPNPVKGEALVGVAVVPSPGAQRSSVLQVYFGAPYSGPLVIETATADGSFRGSGEFAGSSDGAGWVRLQLDSGAGDPVRPADPEALAVAARGDAPSTFRVAHWGDGAVSEDGLLVRLYVNARRGDMSVQAGSEKIRCKRVSGQRLLRFDMYCDVPWASIPDDGTVTLVRRDGFNVLPQRVTIAR